MSLAFAPGAVMLGGMRLGPSRRARKGRGLEPCRRPSLICWKRGQAEGIFDCVA